MKTQQKKESKRKDSDVFFLLMSSRRVCAATSFEAFVPNQHVFFYVVMCFVFSGKVLHFFSLAKILLKARLAQKHGGQWRRFATTLAKPDASYIFNSLPTIELHLSLTGSFKRHSKNIISL